MYRNSLFFLSFLIFPFVVSAEWGNLWLHPTENMSYNPLSEIGFQVIRFEGYMQDNLTYEGFFWDAEREEEIQPIATEVRFIREEEIEVLEVPAESVTIDESGTHYFLEVPLPPELLAEGEWIPEVYFELPDIATVSRMTDEDGNFQMIRIDTTPPDVEFRYTPDTFTNQPIAVEVLCTDASGCAPSEFHSFLVRGNFNAEQNGGVRAFSVCDEVGNCTNPESTQLSIDFYDPIPPRMEGNIRLIRDENIWRDGKGGFEENQLEAHERFIFEINGITDEDNDLLQVEYADQFDDHACGSDVQNNPFYLKEDHCATKMIPCALSAINHGGINQYEGVECVPYDISISCNYDSFPFCFPFRLSPPALDFGFPLFLPFFLSR